MKLVEFFTATFVEILGFLFAIFGGIWLAIHFGNNDTNGYLSAGIILVYVFGCMYGSMWLSDIISKKR